MEITFTKGNITRTFTGDYHITLVAPKEEKNNMESLNELLDNDKLKVAKIDNKKKRRSLNANAYCWKLCTEIADTLRTNKETVYLSMLKRYGQSSIVSVIDEAVPTFLKSVKYTEDFGRGTVNGKEFTHIKVFVGSSEYDTREMAILLDGIVSEAEDLGISTITPTEIEKIKEQWGR